MITVLEPQRLWLLVLVGAVLGAYVWGRRRRAAYPVTLSTLRFAAEAQRRSGRAWRRHLPAAAFLGLLGLLVVGFARPAIAERVPVEAVDVVIALDTSASMEATDVAATRAGAAREAAAEFVDGLPDEARVGVVAFAGGASLAIAPTADHERVLRAIGTAIGPGQGTAIGEAVAGGVAALARPDVEAAESAIGGTGDGGEQSETGRRIVVLSDGNSTAGRPVADAAQQAADAGVRVDTIAFGTAGGSVQVGSETVPVPVEDASLSQLADVTGGRLHAAADADELAEAYADIAGSLGTRVVQREITGTVGLLATACAALVALLGLSRAAVLPRVRRVPPATSPSPR